MRNLFVHLFYVITLVMEKSFYSIFITFFKVGTMLLGGGYVILPLLTSELVEKKKWITSDELCEFYALSSSLPGVIAVNTAIFTGRKLLKTKGAIAAIIGIILPSFLAIVLLASILNEIVHYKSIQNIFWGVGIGVIVLLFFAIKEMWTKCIVDKYTIMVYIICLLLALFTKISPAIIIILSIVIGVLNCQFNNKKEEEND